jgi:D-alanyl-D-alanine carboxypeptidase
MEEASVAGESPDRSKQHESSASSAEATPVTPASVPSPARSGAPMSASAPGPASADPRMAMARERAATVRVDQATAVFSTKALSADASRTAESERAPESEGTSESADPAGGKSVEGDSRLRAAVAAWVSGTDEPAPADSAGSEAASGSESGDGGATDADGAATDVEGAATDVEGAVSESAADAAGDDEAEAGDESDASEPDTDVEPAADGGVDDDIDGETEERRSADQEPETVSGETSRGDEPEDAPTDEPEDRPADASERSAAPAPVDEPEDRPEGALDALLKGRGDGDSDAADDSSDSESDETPDARADEISDTRAEETPDRSADETSVTDAATVTDPATDPATDPEADADSAPEPPVDQPTAIFKAPRPPAVDQPTTMLKLGDAATRRPATGKPAAGPTDAPAAKPAERPADKPAAKLADKPAAKPADKPAAGPTDAPAAKPADKPADKPAERPADKPAEPAGGPERTSRFVALKRDETVAPAWPKPAPAASDSPAAATRAFPQVGPERTTQQPLPPKPPLDLLAELTNTPPPPQTPVRTLVRRVKIWTPLVLLLVVIFAVAQAFRPLPEPALTLTADETYTFDGGTLDLPWPGQGQSAIEVEGVGSLGTDGKQASAPIASVAKIMTAYVILQEHPLKGNEEGEKITVDQQAEDESKLPDESKAPMTKGQQFTERQMLQMLMIPSGNNVARLLSRWDSDAKSFVAKMNAAAEDLGMTNTTYTDPSGLQKTTVSTATDQVKLAKKVMKNDVFRSIVGMAKADIPGLPGTIYNNNDLLVQQVGVIGLKTGSSTPAGGNLVWAATKVVDGKTQTIYGAVMNQNAGTGKLWDSLQLAITNSQKLIDKVQKSLITATVVKKGQVVGYVDDQLGGRTPVVATRNMTAVGWPGLKTGLSIREGRSAVPHTGKAGDIVGELRVGDGSSQAVTIPVALKSDLAEPGFGAKLTRVG